MATKAETHPVLEMLTSIIHNLVDHPEEVDIQHFFPTRPEESHGFTVEAAASDIGKVIGKEGRMARSIRMILGAAAKKHGIVVSLDIVDAKGIEVRD